MTNTDGEMGKAFPFQGEGILGSHSGSTGHHREEKETPYTQTELHPRGQGPAWLKQTLLGPLPSRCGSLPVSGYSRHPTDSTKYHEQEQSILEEGRDIHWMSAGEGLGLNSAQEISLMVDYTQEPGHGAAEKSALSFPPQFIRNHWEAGGAPGWALL